MSNNSNDEKKYDSLGKYVSLPTDILQTQETQTQETQILDGLANQHQTYMDIRDGLDRRMKYYFEMMIKKHWVSHTMEKLGDVCDIEQGCHLTKKNMTDGEYNVIGGGKIIGKHNINNRSGYETIITRVGGELTISFIKESSYLTENEFSIRHSNIITNKFIYYLLSDSHVKSSLSLLYSRNGNSGISKTELENFEIPKIDLKTQTQIVQYINNLETEKNTITETMYQLDTDMREITQTCQSDDNNIQP
jgi:hypothetical protein